MPAFRTATSPGRAQHDTRLTAPTGAFLPLTPRARPPRRPGPRHRATLVLRRGGWPYSNRMRATGSWRGCATGLDIMATGRLERAVFTLPPVFFVAWAVIKIAFPAHYGALVEEDGLFEN